MMAAHPAKTAAHRRVLDAIGCGDPCPPMTAKTRDKMIALGLIVKLGDKLLGRDALGPITIPQYEMPVAVHIDWCNAVAAAIEACEQGAEGIETGDDKLDALRRLRKLLPSNVDSDGER